MPADLYDCIINRNHVYFEKGWQMKGFVNPLFCLVLIVSLVTGAYWAVFIALQPDNSALAEMRIQGWREKVDINSASESELIALPAVGEKRAGQIAELRKSRNINNAVDLLCLEKINKRVIKIIGPYLKNQEPGDAGACKEK